jgi:hypothetical protein
MAYFFFPLLWGTSQSDPFRFICFFIFTARSPSADSATVPADAPSRLSLTPGKELR